MGPDRILARHRVELDIAVRPCREADLRLLEWGAWYWSHREIIERAFEAQTHGENLMLVGDARGFPVAQVWIDLARKAEDGIAILWALRVLPGLRSLGIGRVLVRCAEREARERGFSRVEIGVEHDNPGARRLYEGMGYVEVGEEEAWIDCRRPDGARVRQVIRCALLHRELP